MAIKLDFQAAPVTSFARRSPEEAAQGAIAIGNLASTSLATAGDMRQRWEKMRDEREVRLTDTKLSEISNLNEQYYGQSFSYAGTELEGTNFPGALTELDPNGNEVTKNIPAWQAEPYIRRKDALRDLENAASGITNQEVKNQYIFEHKQRIAQEFDRDIQASLEVGRAQTRFEITRDIAELARLNQFDKAVEMLLKSDVFNADEKAEMHIALLKGVEFFNAQNLIVKPHWLPADFIKAQSQIEYLGSKEYSGKLELPERIQIQNSLLAKAKFEDKKADNEKKMVDVAWTMETEERIANGDPAIDASFILQGFNDNRITASRALGMWSKVLRNWKKKNDQNELIGKLLDDQLSGRGWDRNNKKNRDAINQQYNDQKDFIQQQRLMEGIQWTPENEAAFNKAFILQWDWVPDQIKTQLEGYARQEDPVEIFKGVELYQTISEIAPETIDDLSRRHIDILETSAAGLDMGLSPMDAIQYSLRIRDMKPLEADVIQERNRAINKSTRYAPSELETRLEEFVTNDKKFEWNGWGSVPVKPALGYRTTLTGLPDDMLREFSDLVEKQLVLNKGEIDIAYRRAWNIVKTHWGLTGINRPSKDLDAEIESTIIEPSKGFTDTGKRLMAFPPGTNRGENPALAQVRIRNDLWMQYRDLLSEGEYIEISSDFLTLEEGIAGRRITYPVYRVKGTGEDRQIIGVGRWSYDEARINANWEKKLSSQQEDTLYKKYLNDLKKEQYKKDTNIAP